MENKSLKVKSEISLLLKPVNTNCLIRVGSNNDGGYVVSKKSLNSTKFCLSLGLGRDFTFELDLFNSFGINSHVYDGTVGEPNNLVMIFLRLLKFIRPNSTRYKNYKKWLLDYKKFFVLPNKHINKNVVLSHPKMRQATIFEVLSGGFDRSKTFLKMDIEGSEYVIFQELSKYASELTGMCIEFHEVEKNFNEFKDIMLNMKKTHNLVFVNGNNYSKVNKYNLPDALEISFARRDLNLTSAILTKSDLEILTGGGNSVRYPKYEIVWA